MLQRDVETPHFSLPFQFGGIGGGALCNEQDTSEDVADCVKTIIVYPIGFRDDLPDFGSPDVIFKMISTASIIDRLEGVIGVWEPRARMLSEEDRSEIENFTRHFVMQLRGQVI